MTSQLSSTYTETSGRLTFIPKPGNAGGGEESVILKGSSPLHIFAGYPGVSTVCYSGEIADFGATQTF